MTNILITGANGFVGSNLVRRFINSGYRVNCLVHKNIDTIKKLTNGSVVIYKGTVTDPDSLIEPVKNVDYVFHTAAVLRAIDTETYYKINQYGTKNLIETVYKINPGIKRFIYISSQAAIGPCNTELHKKMDSSPIPVSDYGRSKLMGELELMKFRDKLPITILRPSAIYGPGDKDLFPFFKLSSNGIFPVLGADECKLQLLFVGDLVEICYLITQKANLNHTIYFISDERQYTWSDIYNIISSVLNRKVWRLYFPYWLIYFIAYISEKISGLRSQPAVLNRQKVNELYQKYWLGDSTETKEDFDYKFTDLETGFRITYNWYKENKWL